jgi:MFS family permease
MDWTFWLIGFALAVFMGSALVTLLGTVRPQWTTRRRRLMAASALPLATLLATLVGVLVVAKADHGQGERMEDLAIAALMTIGGGFTLLAWVGGLIGATLASRRRRSR